MKREIDRSGAVRASLGPASDQHRTSFESKASKAFSAKTFPKAPCAAGRSDKPNDSRRQRVEIDQRQHGSLPAIHTASFQ